MAQKEISIGINPNDGNGETLRSAGEKINSNFSELYSIVGASGEITFVNSIEGGTGIAVDVSTGNVTVVNTAPYINSFTSVVVQGQPTLTASPLQSLSFAAGSNVTITTSNVANRITISATQQQVDWNASSGVTSIANKPVIPAAQIQSNWNQIDDQAVDYIKNKPVVATDVSELTDINHILPADEARFISISTVDTGETSTIYTASVTQFAGLQATVFVNVSDGAGGSYFASATINSIMSHPVSGTPVIDKVVYNELNTGTGPIASFDVSWDLINSKMVITMTNTWTSQATVKVSAIEYA